MQTSQAEIVEFVDTFADDFARLNYEWIEKYFSVEGHDREILDEPRKWVIDPGGQIFMAVVEGNVVGTVAMIRTGIGIFELTKMAVCPKFQGQGIANFLMRACLDFGRAADAKTILLESHRSLGPLSLYRKFGFIETPIDPNSEYARADIRMEISLDANAAARTK